ncbi:MAG TPA: SAM-dependent methyltransferase, partial [Caulobacter sp.]|nr:SAM-dependent methyltransferase [Caulobacter sp.]
VTGEAAQAAMAGDMDGAAELFRQALAKGVVRKGKVRFIAGKGPSDLLTLRALRALGAADVLVADDGADPEIVTLARRDAQRLDPSQVAAETLVALAQEGKQIVRLIVAPVDPAVVQALGAAAVAVEVI